MKKLFQEICILFMLTIFVCCSNPVLKKSNGETDPIPSSEDMKGTLSLILNKSDVMRNMLPDISMNIVSYDIIGSGPDSNNFEETGFIGAAFNCYLVNGSWTISVKAKNAENVVIYEGETTVDIVPGETAAADVTVRPLSGYGSLNLTVDWKDNILVNPQVVSTLTPSQGDAKTPLFSITGNKAASTTDLVEAGYHTLIVKLLENGHLAMGKVDVVRIVKDQTTDGTILFNNVNHPDGMITLTINQELVNTLEVNLSGQVETLPENQTMTVTASVPADTGNVTYVWYINGESKEVGETDNPSYTVKDLPKGFYNLDVTAFTADGKRAGSASCKLVVTEPVEIQINEIITAGFTHSLFLKEDRTVWAWGYNTDGQLGDGTTTNKLTPVKVLGLTNIKVLTAGYRHSHALHADGTVWAWGWNSSGQLGDGTATDKHAPVQVQGLTNIKALVAGYSHSLALKEDGSVWAWGNNEYGQLGDGTTTTKQCSPIQIQEFADIQELAAGYSHSLALCKDGTVWAWGSNSIGQLGDGTTIDKHTPVQVPGLTNIKALAVSNYHSLALQDNGTVWAWGSNLYGQLGDGTTTHRNSPIQIPGLTNIKALATGYRHSLALQTDGTVRAWGGNNRSQLGDGTTTDRHTPIQVSGLSNIKAISAGVDHSFALQEDSIVWAWGRNNMGQLGNGTTIDRHTPLQVVLP